MEKFIGLDLGTTTVGIATSDSLGISHGRENFRFEKGNYKKALKRVSEYIDEELINNIVIGLPLQLDRQEGERCASVRRFISDLLVLKPKIIVYYFDESFTTIEARERLHEAGLKEKKIKEIIDMVSAEIILEDFLRSKSYDKK